MPEAARGNAVETADTIHKSIGDLIANDGVACDEFPTATSTDACSGKVFVEGDGVVREGDAVTAHTFPGCALHAPALTSFSSKVTIEGKGAARKGDKYGCGATITSGSTKVSFGG